MKNKKSKEAEVQERMQKKVELEVQKAFQKFLQDKYPEYENNDWVVDVTLNIRTGELVFAVGTLDNFKWAAGKNEVRDEKAEAIAEEFLMIVHKQMDEINVDTKMALRPRHAN